MAATSSVRQSTTIFVNPLNHHVSNLRFCYKGEQKWKHGFKVSATVELGVEGLKRTTSNVVVPLEGGTLGLDMVSEGELMVKGFKGLRKTKLVCTVGPACSSLEDLEKLALGGMNVARLNMCHGTREWHRDVIRKIKKLNEEKGIEVGDELVIDGGMACFVVTEKIGKDLHCKCTDAGLFLPGAKFSFWRDGKLVRRNYNLPTDRTLSTKDWADINFGIAEGVDFFALSFVNHADSVKDLKSYLSGKSTKSIKVVAKIESLESLHNLEEIVKASDGIMVARGDLGVEIPLEQIPTVQEDIINICRKQNKPVIVASQLLQSMVEYPTPTRAEVADVSEAVRQYADALMLSAESAIGSFGQKALAVLDMTSSRMESWSREENRQSLLDHHKLGASLPDCITEQICNCAVEMANKLGVDAIFVYTKHGYMASLLSRNRPDPPIFAFTDDESTRMALNLQWGVVPLLVDLSDDAESNISKSVHLMKSKGLINKGDVVLVVSDVAPTRSTPMALQSIQVKTII
ncbi:hypothetical protein TSUD_47510 [Trifolium subterraneum]|nr:hypothetical protein TSUD_47510 [Trifolium subterraneum]